MFYWGFNAWVKWPFWYHWKYLWWRREYDTSPHWGSAQWVAAAGHTVPFTSILCQGPCFLIAVISGIRDIISHPMMQDWSLWGHWPEELRRLWGKMVIPIVSRIILGNQIASVWLDAIVSAEIIQMLRKWRWVYLGSSFSPNFLDTYCDLWVYDLTSVGDEQKRSSG